MSGLPEHVRHVLEARLAVARVTAGKALALEHRVCADGRLRGALAYYAAHTGRWAGRGFQPQNLPRPVAGVPDDAWVPDAPRLAAELDMDLSDILGSMLRGVLVAPDGWMLATVDYSSIEARGLLWLAGDEDGLEVYRQGGDPYVAAASGIFGRSDSLVSKEQRHVGKVAVLACGYQGGPAAFERMARGYGVSITGLDVVGVVDAWRDQHPLVAGRRAGLWQTPDGRTVVVRRGGLWRNIQAAVMRVLQTGVREYVGRCWWAREGEHLTCRLPSGRHLVYRDAKVIPDWPDRWGGTKPAITYVSPRRGLGRIATYGGKLVENCWAAGTLIETQRGPIPIEQVSSDDHVWDGVEWVSTGGAICRGKQRVGSWLGVRGTLNHRVHDGTTWRYLIDYHANKTKAALRWAHSLTTWSGHVRVPAIHELDSSVGQWRSLPEKEGVWDLLDCGPRHSYAVLTPYGMVIAHNCTQAVCRDLLADALVRLEAAGVRVVLHVHDEVVAEVRDEAGLRFVEDMMRTQPEWSLGLPIEVEGKLRKRYGK